MLSISAFKFFKIVALTFRKSNMATQYLKIAAVVLAYWFISISMVFANKYILGSRDSGKDISLFAAWTQCFVCVGLGVGNKTWKSIRRRSSGGGYLKVRRASLSSSSSKGVDNQSAPHQTTSSAAAVNTPFVWGIMQMTCTYVGMLTFNNLCLKNVGVAFYQVARSLTLIFVVFLSVIMLKKKVSWRVVLCCVMVAGGFVLGVDQESLAGTLSVGGVIFGVITSLFVSLNGIFTKTALDVVDHDSVKLTFYNNINAVILFFPFVLFTGQFGTVYTSPEYHTFHFWACLLSSGVLGFLIAWISAVQIDITSPVTHHISANLKAVMQTVIAVMWGGEGGTKSGLWWVSILMVVAGAFAYAINSMHEEKEKKKQDVEKHKRTITDSNRNLLEELIQAEEGGNKGRERSNTN